MSLSSEGQNWPHRSRSYSFKTFCFFVATFSVQSQPYSNPLSLIKKSTDSEEDPPPQSCSKPYSDKVLWRRPDQHYGRYSNSSCSCFACSCSTSSLSSAGSQSALIWSGQPPHGHRSDSHRTGKWLDHTWYLSWGRHSTAGDSDLSCSCSDEKMTLCSADLLWR